MSHVVFDARAAFPARDGLGTYLREVVPRIVAEATEIRATILVNPKMIGFWEAAAPGAGVIASTCRAMWVGQNWQIPRLLERLRPDLYFYPAHDPPLLGRTPMVFTIHDLTPLEFGPYFERLNAAKTAYIRQITGSALQRAQRVMVMSESTKSSVGRIYGTRFLGKVRVTPNGVARDFRPQHAPANGRPCLLYVGTDRPHKNLDRLIAAYALARSREPSVPVLEIVGGLRRESHLRDLIQRAGVEGFANLRGHVTDAELEGYYSRAVALMLPSLAEGFGLPIVEGMVRSVPVVTSNRSACAEVAGSAALLVDPESVESIAAGILQIASDGELRERLVVAGKQQAALFSWERCAAETLDAIREVIAAPAQTEQIVGCPQAGPGARACAETA